MAKIILIVEDEANLADALHDKLTREGFNILKAKNGEEGLATAFTRHPDLILLDILMPKMDGLTVLKKLREDAWGKLVQVIIFTNYAEAEKISEALSNKVTDYLVKADWDIDAIAKKIKEKLQ
jgi:DNA-binding response OmpR family regulator